MIKVENLSFTYSDSNTPALDHLDLEIKKGEFIILAGRNGSGKSTLIKALLGIIPDSITGNFQGRILLSNEVIKDTLSLASKIGVLLQNPDTQITNLTVWEETVFGLENLCWPINQIFQQANSSLNCMGLAKIMEQQTHQLSGGQKQRLSLASLLAMNPKVLIMDEPLASLDNEGVNSVLDTLKSIRSQVDLIIISSHVLEPFLGLMTRTIVMDKGKIVLDFPADKINDYHQELISNAVELPPKQSFPVLSLNPPSINTDLINLEHVSFNYSNGIKPLIDVNLKIHQGEKLTLIGSNGAGKSTLAKLLVGLKKPASGKITSHNLQPKIIPQEASLSFMENSILEELLSQNINQKTINEILEQCGLTQDKLRSPFQLSGGQQRLLAIAMTAATNPNFIVIDEPTSGLDADHVRLIIQMMSGIESVLHITHDYRVIPHSNRIITLHDGKIIEKGDKL